MPKSSKIFFVLIIVLAIFGYSISPILRDIYKNWDDSNQREWREKWLREEQARQDVATKRYAELKSLSSSMPGSKDRINVKINYKAVGFNQVAFRLNIEPLNDSQFTNFIKDRIRGETLLYLNLRDADGFLVDEIEFTRPTRITNKEGVCVAMSFEETHQVEFSELDKVYAVDISTRSSFD